MTEADRMAKRDIADAEVSLGLWPGHKAYEIGKVLGRGAFGSVFEGQTRRNGTRVAIKRIDSLFSSRDVVVSALREVFIHAHLDSCGGRGSVARLLEVMPPDENDAKFDHIYSVYEKYDASLYKSMQTSKWRLVTPEEKRILAFQLSECVARLHACNVAHRDIKPENIVLKYEFSKVALCDLGMARNIGEGPNRSDCTITDYVTTRWYRAPEVCCGTVSSSPAIGGVEGGGMLAADIWSLGCVLGEILSDDPIPIFCGSTSQEQTSVIGTALGKMGVRTRRYYELYANNREVYKSMIDASTGCVAYEDECHRRLHSICDLVKCGVPKQAVDLLQMMLTYDPRRRISAEDVLSHRFFSGLKRDNRPIVKSPCLVPDLSDCYSRAYVRQSLVECNSLLAAN